MPTMSLQTSLLGTLLLLSILFASSRSGSFNNNTKTSEKEPFTTFSTPLHINNGTANNRTNLKSTTSILLSKQEKERQSNSTTTTSPTISHSKELSKSSQLPSLDTLGPSKSLRNSPGPRAESVKGVEKHSTVLVVSLVLAFCLSAVGVVVAVFFVRRKRIKKMKKGFQEEMAVICLHDEMATEALYSSWKPFMDGNENNKVKLVIETRPNDGTTAEANT
ncbi:hypothetical protein ACROYT_G042721 [Oculina patagonica]